MSTPKQPETKVAPPSEWWQARCDWYAAEVSQLQADLAKAREDIMKVTHTAFESLRMLKAAEAAREALQVEHERLKKELLARVDGQCHSTSVLPQRAEG